MISLYRGMAESSNKFVYGHYVTVDDNEVGDELIHYIVGRIDYMRDICDAGLVSTPVIGSTVGMFTGKLDKNRKRIFDGDIIKSRYGQIFLVYYCDSEFCWFVKNRYGMTGRLHKVVGDVEILGNIYANPELLEVSR